MKYLDPDGRFTYDKNDPTIIRANLDDLDDLCGASNAISEAERGIKKIIAYGDSSGITKEFYNYRDVCEYIWKFSPHYDLSFSAQVGGSKEEGARALYFDAFISNTNLNRAGINFGVAQATIPLINIGNNSKLSLTLNGFDGKIQLSSFPLTGGEITGTICSATIDYSYNYNNTIITVSFGGMIGWGASFGIGPDGVFYSFANGYGPTFSLNIQEN